MTFYILFCVIIWTFVCCVTSIHKCKVTVNFLPYLQNYATALLILFQCQCLLNFNLKHPFTESLHAQMLAPTFTFYCNQMKELNSNMIRAFSTSAFPSVYNPSDATVSLVYHTPEREQHCVSQNATRTNSLGSKETKTLFSVESQENGHPTTLMQTSSAELSGEIKQFP